MAKRIGVSALWYLAVGWGLNYLALIVGFSTVLVYVAAFATAAFVAIDPAHLFWPTRGSAASGAPAAVPAPVEGLTQAA